MPSGDHDGWSAESRLGCIRRQVDEVRAVRVHDVDVRAVRERDPRSVGRPLRIVRVARELGRDHREARAVEIRGDERRRPVETCTNASFVPSGDHVGSPSFVSLVTRVVPVPSAFTMKIPPVPPILLEYASFAPFGDHAGLPAPTATPGFSGTIVLRPVPSTFSVMRCRRTRTRLPVRAGENARPAGAAEATAATIAVLTARASVARLTRESRERPFAGGYGGLSPPYPPGGRGPMRVARSRRRPSARGVRFPRASARSRRLSTLARTFRSSGRSC